MLTNMKWQPVKAVPQLLHWSSVKILSNDICNTLLILNIFVFIFFKEGSFSGVMQPGVIPARVIVCTECSSSSAITFQSGLIFNSFRLFN